MVTVHVPRRPYANGLPGIPTIRVFEALACGIPLVCAPWRTRKGCFARAGLPGGADGTQMTEHLRDLLHDARGAPALAEMD